MVTAKKHPTEGRIVLVVGVDLTDISEKLLETASDLVRHSGKAEIHVVHVVAPESLRMRLEEPLGSVGIENRSHIESAQFLLNRLREGVPQSGDLRIRLHTPVGTAARELARIAREVNADVIVVEAHEHGRRPLVLHRSLVGKLARSAPCSVLAVRRRASAGEARAAT
jgi:nucleotide-binding universal stress UspA family protein